MLGTFRSLGAFDCAAVLDQMSMGYGFVIMTLSTVQYLQVHG